MRGEGPGARRTFGDVSVERSGGWTVRAPLWMVLNLVAAVGLSACGGGSSVSPSSQSQAFGLNPSSVSFSVVQPLPQPARVALQGSGAAGTAVDFTVSVDDPTQVGAEAISAASGVALLLTPISSGRTGASAVHVSDLAGAAATVSVNEGLCGRPDNLSAASRLVYPRSGSQGVSAHIGKLYFAVFSQAQTTTTHLHLIVGSHGTLEGSRLVRATPPRGAAVVAPRPGFLLTTMAATVPDLAASTRYHAQLYDDACQPPLIAGAFST